MSLFDGLMAQVHRKVGKKYIDIFAGLDPLADTVRNKCEAEIMYDRLVIAARGIRCLLPCIVNGLTICHRPDLFSCHGSAHFCVN